MRLKLQMIIIWIKINIIYPIKAWWNFHINHRYITDNIRNRALMEYCEKIMSDFSYQPSGAYENLFEDKLKEAYNRVVEYMKSITPEDEEINWEILSYEEERPFCAAQIYESLLQMPWVQE